MKPPLSITRGKHKLTVTQREGGFSLTTSGGGNITQAEYDQIAGHVEGETGAEAFLEKLQARMQRP